jgi:arginine utilization protein RocB
MYEVLKDLSMEDQIEWMTKKLVSMPSVNGTSGEREKAEFIQQMICSFPYFAGNPHDVWEQETLNDSTERKNIFAFIKGNGTSNKTIIFHAHLDTVSIDDFGALRHEAFQPEVLQEFFKKYEQDADVQQDALSGDWIFGRGSVDMQSGIAVHLSNLLYFSNNIDELNGNVLFMVNPDEESQHAGIKSAIHELNRLKTEWGLEFKAAINNDFISPHYEGDNTRYIYTGAAGKILPSFYIYGREVHVGDTLTGVDPNFIAAELTKRIHNNMDLCEDMDGEMVLPPTCLFQRDNKSTYNVQTATSSYLYFNYFLYKSSAKEVLNRLLTITNEACNDVTNYLSKQYDRFVEKTKLPRKSLHWEIEVYSFEDYCKRLQDLKIDTKQVCETVAARHKGEDLRNISFKIMEVLNELDPSKNPRIILFFAPPYLPHNYLREEVESEKAIHDSIRALLEEEQGQQKENFELKKFFPFLADGSYLSIHETNEELESLLHNLPDLGDMYSLPIQEIRRLNIPSLNFGVYGKDGHKWTERVYKPYTFTVLPELIRKATVRLLKS